jgi:hypothetical protein
MIQGSNSSRGEGFFSSETSRPDPATTQPPVERIPVFFLAVKRSGHNVDHSPPSSAEIGMNGAIPLLPHIRHHGVDRSSFIFQCWKSSFFVFWYSWLEYVRFNWVGPGISIIITESDRDYFQNWAVFVSLTELYPIGTYAGLAAGEKPASRFVLISWEELLVPGDTCSSKEKNLPGVESTQCSP